MIPSKTKNIVFDLGGVLYHIDYSLTKRAFETLGIQQFDSHFSQKEQSTLFDDLETGRISSMVFLNTMKGLLPQCSNQKIKDAWNALLLGFPKEHLALLNCLSKKYNLYLLSNTNSIHIEQINKEFNQNFGTITLKSLFKKTYLSHQIGRRKPDVSTFQWLLKDANIIAHETVFIDDSTQHIESAKKAGFRTIQWPSNKALVSLFPDKAL